MSDGAKFATFLVCVIIAAVALASTLASVADSYVEVVDEKGCRVVESIDNRFGPGNVTRTVQTYCPVKEK